MNELTQYPGNEYSILCPRPTCQSCGSQNIHTRNYGRRSGAALGAALGGIAGYTQAAEEVSDLSTVSVAILAAFTGALTAGLAGCALGKFVDDKILENYQCRDCNHSF